MYASTFFSNFALALEPFKVGDKAIYKYSKKFMGDSDYRYETDEVIEIENGGRRARVNIVEQIGKDGEVTYEDDFWFDLDSRKDTTCKKTDKVTVPAGTYDVCLDLLGPEGDGPMINLDFNWLFVRFNIRVCLNGDCNTYTKDLIDVKK